MSLFKKNKKEELCYADGNWFPKLFQIEREILAEIDPEALEEVDKEYEELLSDSEE